MTDEKKQEFVNRITTANRTELIVVLYDIFDAYADEASAGYENGRKGNDDSRQSLEKASLVLEHLKKDLDFSRDKALCGRLYSIYNYCEELISRAIYTGRYEEVQTARRLISPLREAFAQVAADDKSAPMMENVPEIVAGYTYGKSGVDEAEVGGNSNRGFLV